MTTFQPSLNGLSFICEPVCSDLGVMHYVLKKIHNYVSSIKLQFANAKTREKLFLTANQSDCKIQTRHSKWIIFKY